LANFESGGKKGRNPFGLKLVREFLRPRLGKRSTGGGKLLWKKSKNRSRGNFFYSCEGGEGIGGGKGAGEVGSREASSSYGSG